MTYVPKRRPNRVMRKRRSQALGGVLDTLFGGDELTVAGAITSGKNKITSGMGTDCLASANAQTADLDARWYNLAQNWHPTGNYTPDDVTKILQTGMVALMQAKVIVVLAPRYTNGEAETFIAQAVDDIDKQIRDSVRFDNAMATAKAQGIAVAAPELKSWLTQSLLVASNAFMVRAVLECDASWLDQAGYYLAQAYNVAVAIEGIAIDAAIAAVHVAAGAFDAVKFIADNAKWGLLIAGVYVAYRVVSKDKHQG